MCDACGRRGEPVRKTEDSTGESVAGMAAWFLLNILSPSQGGFAKTVMNCPACGGHDSMRLTDLPPLDKDG